MHQPIKHHKQLVTHWDVIMMKHLLSFIFCASVFSQGTGMCNVYDCCVGRRRVYSREQKKSRGDSWHQRPQAGPSKWLEPTKTVCKLQSALPASVCQLKSCSGWPFHLA